MASGNVIYSAGTVGPNTTSFVHNFGANKELQPVIYVEAFNDAGVSSRVAVNISTAGCP